MILIQEFLFIFFSLLGTIPRKIMISLEMDYQFTYLNLLTIILPQLALILLYFLEKLSRQSTRGKLLWLYNYNRFNKSLQTYLVPFLTLSVYILAFLIPVFFQNVLGVLYLLFILARDYLLLRSRINLISTLLMLLYFAFFLTREIWPSESVYVSFLLDPRTASFDFILVILLVDLLHDLGSFLHMYLKLKKKNLAIIKKQSWKFREMILTKPTQSFFKSYYLMNFERVTNSNFKKIRSNFANRYLDDMIWINSVYICGCDGNKLYDEDENKKYQKGELLQLINYSSIPEEGKQTYNILLI